MTPDNNFFDVRLATDDTDLKAAQRLLKAGYSEKQVAGMWGGNVLRLLGQVQALADPKALEAL